jgi:hypothetical protein
VLPAVVPPRLQIMQLWLWSQPGRAHFSHIAIQDTTFLIAGLAAVFMAALEACAVHESIARLTFFGVCSEVVQQLQPERHEGFVQVLLASTC